MKIFVSIFCIFLFCFNLYSANISGKVTLKDNNEVSNAVIIVKELSKTIKSNSSGIYNINIENPGDYTLVFKYLNYSAIKNIKIKDVNEKIELNAELSETSYNTREVIVYGASKRPEKITESPSAVSIKYPEEIEKASRTGQLADVFKGVVGVDILQSGSSDFIVNTRGFNSGLNRRILVLQDGRDAAMPLLGAQEWNSFSMPLEDFSRVELVRGPSAALYGANAFNGVLNLTGYAPKEIVGTKISILAGEQNTYKADVRHADTISSFGYRLNLGYSTKLNYAHRRDSLQYLEEYLTSNMLEKKVMTSDNRTTKSFYGSLRLDYDLSDSKTINAEFGYSRSFNEIYVFGLGRTLVKEVERPYLRLAYNSDDINIHFHYMNRSCPDSMWLMIPNGALLDDSKDFLLDAQYNFNPLNNLNIIAGASYQKQLIRTFGTSIPNDVDAYYAGAYTQAEYKATDFLKLVGSIRYDYAEIHDPQLSPRVSLVISPSVEHQFRLSFGRAFQRPNYSELYRLTPNAPAFSISSPAPVNFAAIQAAINDTLSKLTGSPQAIDLGLNAFNSKAVGNSKLKVESIYSLELGYKGIITEDLYITLDLYYNKMNDFITNFLPGVNTNIEKWQANLDGDLAQYNELVSSMVYSNLKEKDAAALSIYEGKPTFIVSNANVGEVEQYGLELDVNYNITSNLSLNANYSYYDFKVVDANKSQPLLPNTSPHRFNFSVNYEERKAYDASISFNYTEGYEWLAGTFTGSVPSYAYINLSAGYYIMDNLHFGVNVFNVLDRKFYQIYGGTYLPRYATAKLTLNL